MSKTLEELNKEYQYEISPTMEIHPTHKKWISAAWEIQNVYGHLHNETISLGKARELTTAIIEKFSQQTPSPQVLSDEDGVAFYLSELIRTVSRVSNKFPDALFEHDLDRLAQAKNILKIHSNTDKSQVLKQSPLKNNQTNSK